MAVNIYLKTTPVGILDYESDVSVSEKETRRKVLRFRLLE